MYVRSDSSLLCCGSNPSLPCFDLDPIVCSLQPDTRSAGTGRSLCYYIPALGLAAVCALVSDCWGPAAVLATTARPSFYSAAEAAASRLLMVFSFDYTAVAVPTHGRSIAADMLHDTLIQPPGSSAEN